MVGPVASQAGVARSGAVPWAPYAAAGTAALLSPFVVAADRAGGMRPAQVAIDVLVGLALAASGLLGRPQRQGALVSLIGAGWLLGSLLPAATTLSRGFLLFAVLAFPAGLVRPPWGWWPYAAAALVALPGCPQAVVGPVFLGAAALMMRTRAPGGAQPLAAGVALLAGLVQLLGAFAAASGTSELLAVSREGYTVVLVAVAVGFPWASRRNSRQLVDVVAELTNEQPGDPWDRLAQLLGATLGDRDLRVQPGAQSPDLHDRVWRRGSPRELRIRDGDRQVAVVTSTSAALDDPQTAGALADAVRLLVRHTDVVAQEGDRVAELAASQARLVTAEDLERATLGAALRDRVGAPIESVAQDLRAMLTDLGDGTTTDAVAVALQELDSAVAETHLMVAGLPPSELGAGRLADVLQDLTRRSPIPMTMTVDPEAVGDRAAETVIYAACAEALTNALKHSGAKAFSGTVSVDGDELVARLADDGKGGADPSGRGLQGLADRLAARGGTLRLAPGPGGGTVVVARAPRWTGEVDRAGRRDRGPDLTGSAATDALRSP